MAAHVYRVQFLRENKLWEIYAKKVSHGGLFGFIEVEDLLFGTRSSVVVDPGEERIRLEFDGIKRTYIPLSAIVRIDEVKKGGPVKISAFEGGNVTPFPLPHLPGGGESGRQK
jgi:hypothetical protein